MDTLLGTEEEVITVIRVLGKAVTIVRERGHLPARHSNQDIDPDIFSSREKASSIQIRLALLCRRNSTRLGRRNLASV